MVLRHAENNDIEIRVDLEQSNSIVEYRLINEEAWNPTPFQRAEFNTEDDALKIIDAWLEK